MTEVSAVINSHLVSYAFLKVDSNNDRDYYDYFTPFIIEILDKIDEEIVVANQVQKLLDNEFKIFLPIKVIETLLRRLKKRGLLYSHERTYRVNKEKIDNRNFLQRKQQILMQHTFLIDALIKYAKDTYDTEYDYLVAEQSLNSLISHNQLTFLKDSLMNKTSELSLSGTDSKHALIASNFIQEIHKNNPPLYNHLIEIVKGRMLLNALYVVDGRDLEHIKMKFKKTEIYFDTSFLLYALGYSGPELEKPCLELIDLLKGSNAILRCFSHNVDEARGILEYCKKNLSKPNGDKHGTISTFVQNKYDESDVDSIIFGLEDSIKQSLQISITDGVPYEKHEHESVIGEADLAERLNQRIGYKHKRALDKDVASISAIVRIRKNSRTIHLEDCKALFVTTNFNLAKYSREYFTEEYEPKIVTPVMHDSLLMNFVWLKNPQIAPDLPSSILMADCYAAGVPSEKVWEKYVSVLETLRDTGQLTEDKFYELKFSSGIRTLVMDETFGDENIITVGTVTSIMQKIEAKKREDRELAVEEERLHQQVAQETLQVNLEASASELKDAKADLLQKDMAIRGLSKKPSEAIRSIAENKARSARRFINVLIWFVIASTTTSLVYFSSGLSIKWTLLSIFLTTSFPFLLGLFGYTLIGPLNKVEGKLASHYEKKLMKVAKL